MDGLDRQPGEKFHEWASRIQCELRCFEGTYQPYPRSHQLVEQYIGRIRQPPSRPPLPLPYMICCFCNQMMYFGFDRTANDQLYNLHGYICPSNINYSRTVQKTIRFQKIFRGYITRKKLKAAKIIRQAVFPWLYRPGGPLMQKAEKRFNRLVELQRM